MNTNTTTGFQYGQLNSSLPLGEIKKKQWYTFLNGFQNF